MNKRILLWAAIALLLFGLANIILGKHPDSTGSQGNLPYSAFLEHVENHRVASVHIEGRFVSGTLEKGGAFKTYIPDVGDPGLMPLLRAKGVEISAAPVQNEGSFFNTLLSWFPMLLLIGVWIFFMRRMGGAGGGGGLGGFGKSQAHLLHRDMRIVTFADVAGVDEAKAEVEEIVEFLRDPYRFEVLGGKIPKGVLLVGPPGTGKTLLARAIAGEANVPFFTVSGSGFVEMFVGVGAARVRDMFAQAKKNAPCIIFIDELDAVGRHRGAGIGGGNDEREQTLNQILVEMDGFETNEGVIIVAATNRPDVLDPAILRPGRFDRQVVVPVPDVLGREQILKVHTRKIRMAGNIDLRKIARGTPGLSGADLANLANEAALLAARKRKHTVTSADFEEAKDKVLMGAERRSMVMSDDEKKLTAYHEAGHAIVTLNVPVSDPLHKVTIIPRGRALGVTMSLPERDHLSVSLLKLESRLIILFGGRVAEELVFGAKHVSTGASNDILQATRIARAMVSEYGMSEKLGLVRYRTDEEEVFLGHSIGQQKNVSNRTAELIDEEVRDIISHAAKRALDILTEHREDLTRLAEALLEHETLSGEDIKRLLAGEDIQGNREYDEKPAGGRMPLHGSVPETGTRPEKGKGNPNGTL